jgi:GAF domain-containing protein
MLSGQPTVRSYLAVPVVARSGEVLGTMFFGHPEAGIFTERTERIVRGIAAQAAVAIDNTRLYEAAQRPPRNARCCSRANARRAPRPSAPAR